MLLIPILADATSCGWPDVFVVVAYFVLVAWLFR